MRLQSIEKSIAIGHLLLWLNGGESSWTKYRWWAVGKQSKLDRFHEVRNVRVKVIIVVFIREMVSLIPRLSSFAVSGTPARATVDDLIHVIK